MGVAMKGEVWTHRGMGNKGAPRSRLGGTDLSEALAGK